MTLPSTPLSPQRVSWRRLAVPVYGPTALVSTGVGAITPLVALTARDLGASLSTAALIVALIGVGQLVGDLPAGALAARIGEKYALMGAAVVDALALGLAYRAESLLVLGIAVFITGLATAVFGLARQAYLAEVAPVSQRARAMSTLGGVFRLGSFLGPFVGAALVVRYSIETAFGFAAVMSVAAAALLAFLPDVTRAHRQLARSRGTAHLPVFSVLRRHRRVLLLLGSGVLTLSAIRATRQAILPLWADFHGISPAVTSVLFGISAGVDLLLFYPSGAIMDRFGRAFVAVPAMVVLGLGLLLLPLTSTAWSIGLVAVVMGLGNGISAGVVLTLGADTAPPAGRTQYLGGWRLCADAGNAGGPLVISTLSLFAPLAVAALVLGLVAWGGAAWFARVIPHFVPRPRTLPAGAPVGADGAGGTGSGGP